MMIEEAEGQEQEKTSFSTKPTQAPKAKAKAKTEQSPLWAEAHPVKTEAWSDDDELEEVEEYVMPERE